MANSWKSKYQKEGLKDNEWFNERDNSIYIKKEDKFILKSKKAAKKAKSVDTLIKEYFSNKGIISLKDKEIIDLKKQIKQLEIIIRGYNDEKRHKKWFNIINKYFR